MNSYEYPVLKIVKRVDISPTSLQRYIDLQSQCARGVPLLCIVKCIAGVTLLWASEYYLIPAAGCMRAPDKYDYLTVEKRYAVDVCVKNISKNDCHINKYIAKHYCTLQ